MQKNTEKNQDTIYQERLRRSRIVLDAIRKGIWEQEHGIVLENYSQPKNQTTNQETQK